MDLPEIVVKLFGSKALFVTIVTIFTIALAIFLNWVLARAYNRAVESFWKKNVRFGSAIPIMDRTKFNMVRRVFVTLVYVLGILLIISAIPELKKFSYSIFAGAGVLAVIIGFATQKVFSNIVGGIFVSMFEPFRIGDRISVGTDMGYVDDITLWHTVIRTFENQRLMIPNANIAEDKIINFSITDEKSLNFIDFGISYDSDIELARKIIGEEAKKSKYSFHNEEQRRFVDSDEPIKVRSVEHGDYAIKLRLYVWTQNATDGFLMKCELLENVKKRFDKVGVEIPFPYRTIIEKRRMRKPKKLK